MTDESSETVHLVAMLRLLSELQTRFHPAPLPGLAAWLAARATPLIERWQNRDHRAQVSARLAELTAAGLLPPIASLLHDPSGQELDARELRVAQAELARLDEALTVITGDGPRRAVIAAHIGQEIAAGLGVGAVAVAMVLAAIG